MGSHPSEILPSLHCLSYDGWMTGVGAGVGQASTRLHTSPENSLLQHAAALLNRKGIGAGGGIAGGAAPGPGRGALGA